MSGAAESAAPASQPAPAAASARRSTLAVWWQGLTAVVPWWLGAIALAGVALGTGGALIWVFPLAVCAVLPSILVYVEPRSLLPLAPLAAVYAAVAACQAEERLRRRWARWPGAVLPAALAVALFWPAVRDLVQASAQATPLQQVAVAQRTVGEYLDRHLPAGAIVMSFHPAIAIWANRPWRVLPDDSFERIAAYASAETASAIVFSRFGPSPLAHPPRAFSIILPGSSASAATGGHIEVVPLEETPLLFVGRLAAARRSP